MASRWVYNTTVRSTLDGIEYHVWERLYPNGEIRITLTNPKFGFTPPPLSSGSWGDAETLNRRQGIDIRGRESSAEELA